MLGGRIGQPIDLEFRLAFEGESPGAYGGDGQLSTDTIFNSVLLEPGLFLGFSTSSETTIWTLISPKLGLNHTWTRPGNAGELVLRLNRAVAVSTFSLGALVLLLQIDGFEVILNGELVHSGVGGSWTSKGFAPGYLPLIGLPPVLTGSVAAHLPEQPVPPYAYLIENQATLAITGGWRFRETGTDEWVAAPIMWPEVPLPEQPCAAPSLSPAGIVTGGTTHDVALNLMDARVEEAVVMEFGGLTRRFTRQTFAGRSGWAVIFANWPKTMQKFGDRYGELVARGGFPYTVARGTRTCAVPGQVGGDEVRGTPLFGITKTRDTQIHPSLGRAERLVERESSELEVPLERDTLSFFGAGAGEGRTMWISDLDLPGETVTRPPLTDVLEGVYGSSVGAEFPFRVQDASNSRGCPDPNPDQMGYLRWNGGAWLDLDARRVLMAHSWAHPAWSFWTPFADWPVDGLPASKTAYWAKLGEQWFGERNTLVSAPLREGALRTFVNQITEIGYETSFWGTPDVSAEPLVLPTETVATAGPARWTVEGGTVSFSTAIVLVTRETDEVTVRYDLASIEAAPFLSPLLAKAFGLGWEPDPEITVEVFAVGVDGSKCRLTNEPGTAFLPAHGLASTVYAGSWAQDFGVGAVNDFGEDLLPYGESPAANADYTRCLGPQLLPARQARWLEFKVQFSGSAQGLTLEYPRFFNNAEPKSVTETRQYASVLTPHGPGVRFGNVTFATPTSNFLLNPPVPRPPGKQSTALDAFVWRRVLLEGKEGEEGLDAEIADRYEFGLEYLQRKHLAEDTHAWVWDGKLFFSNSWVPPPLAMFPARGRTAQGIPVPGTWSNQLLTVAERWRNHIRPAGGLPLRYNNQTLEPGPTPPGWEVWRHAWPVTNSESGWNLISGETAWAEIRPWHGFFGVFPVPSGEFGTGLDISVGPWGAFHQVLADATGTLHYAGTSYPNVRLPLEIASAIGEGRNPCVRQTHRLRLVVTFDDDENTLLVQSDDDGHSWRSPIMILANAILPRHTVGRIGEAIAGFRPSESDPNVGTLILKYRDHGTADWSPEQTLRDETGAALRVASSGFALSQLHSGPEFWVLACHLDGESGPSLWQCAHEGEWQFFRVN